MLRTKMKISGQPVMVSEPTLANGKWACWLYGIGLLMAMAPALATAQTNPVPVSALGKTATGGAVVGRIDITQLPKIRTANMNINYRIFTADGQAPLRVELWYARGMGGDWQLYDYDEDRVSPMPVIAPGEGVYRFLVVAVDRWGRRSYNELNQAGRPPGQAVPPAVPSQQVVLVDYTAPRLYLQHPQGNLPDYRAKRLPIRWVGFDSHLDARPVKLYCQRQGSEHWVAISGPQPAHNEFMWEIPERFEGPVIIKVVMTDQAGNQTEQSSGVIQIHNDFTPSNTMDWPAPTEIGAQVNTEPKFDPNQSSIVVPEEKAFTLLERQEKAKLYFDRGNLYSQRLEWEQAARAFRKVLEYEPKSVPARVNLANALFRLGQLQEAQAEYERCLQENRHQESALFGLAQIQIRLQQYDKAQQTLANLLKEDRRDWQAWLMHGNVSAQLGQREAAVTSWQQASHDMSPVRKLAQERLLRYNDE
jgi:predicted negative regulator of RcsB-dependent stress response